jgi:bacterioferritin
MDQETLAFKLREFYVLEAYQLKLYTSQLPSLQDEHVIKAYERISELEQRHVDYFAEKLLELGLSKPELTEDAFNLAGFLSAKALDLLSYEERYKLGVAVETKASEMYGEFISKGVDDKELVQMLWHNRIDEEFHKYWFAANLEALTKGKK